MTYLCAPIALVSIVSTTAPVFPLAQVPDSLSPIVTSRKLLHIDLVSIIAVKSQVGILTRRPI